MRLLPASLRGRLLLLAALVTVLALALFSVQLSALFRQHVERGARATLERHLERLIVSLSQRPDGSWRMDSRLADPRFARPLSGLYWQVNNADGRELLRSRSLWDAALPRPPAPLPRQGALTFEAAGPNDERLLILARRITLANDDAVGNGQPDARQAADTPLVVMVAMNKAEVEDAVAAFRREAIISLLLLGAVLLLALFAQVSIGLRPLVRLRRQIAALRKGEEQALQTPPITELRMLVEELNKLLRAQQQHMEQARARAGNLAHGLKTPLAAIIALAREMAARGNTQDARALLHQATLLRQQVEHELSRARVRGNGNARHSTLLKPVLQRLLRTLRTLRPRDSLQWRLELPEGLAVGMHAGDLLELAGNLMDNAAKWAHSHVLVRAERLDDGRVALTVEDDGPGVSPGQRQRIIERGVRLDEKVPGSGLGLAIVQEVVQAYRGEMLLGESAALGGLKVRITLPGPPA